MTSQMRAAVYEEPQRLNVEGIPVPEVGPQDLLIRVGSCGICGSDVHSYKAGMYIRPGQAMGHEFMGVAETVGSEVRGVEPGDRLTGFDLGVCGECYWCSRQQYALCPELFQNSTGYGKPGAFAEYVLITNAAVGRTVHRVPDSLDDETAATAEPVSVGIAAVEQAGVGAAERVVVLGAGMIGNACMQAAKAAGAEVAVVEVRIVDEGNRNVPEGEVGEIVYRGPTVFKDYHNNPEATAEVFEGGWFHSGDLVRRDEEGYIYVVDRTKDMFVSGGENIYPAEIERVLGEHPAVKEAAVIGVPHEKWGETPKALLVLKPGETLNSEEIIQHCRAHLAGYKKPSYVAFVDELPRNAASKVLRRELRRLHGGPDDV